ncbi:histidine biosynthesis trifunctional-protein [Boletus reticuloceps]|uniref:Histidine biosynthesis trifunctional protein n=1 Tax=Boletus reticuloceps TaxID=495285 RepID=A0A8I2YV27_9AGAM|nr:histidine biosynthesis trifunctional-protein [Boletus reticuloceps]
MPPPFLVLVDTDDVQQDRLLAVCRVTSVIFRRTSNFPLLSARNLLIDDASADPDQIIADLESGIDKAIVPLSLAKKLVGIVPATRLILLLDVANVSAVPDSLRKAFFWRLSIHVLSEDKATPSVIRKLTSIGASLVIPFSQLETSITIADAFLALVISDRSDGLFPTIVSSYALGGRSLGLVYSSRESVAQSILTGKGIYQSRKHGIWEKGKTSGATQEVVRIRIDLRLGYTRILRHPTRIDGLAALQSTLTARLASAPEGSYTHRLFNDQELLQAKIKEEADELCRAETKEEIAFEAADLWYFTLTRCVAAGVTLRDIEEVLNKKAAKITRRPGNAKPQFISNDRKPQDAPKSRSRPQVAVDLNAPIAMRTVDLSFAGPEERAELLKRPVLRSDEMIAKVKPIVDDVRKRGDTALLELTAKFDKAQLEVPMLLPPFYPLASAAVELDPAVKDAINVAYANVRKFHAAQVQDSHLVVETMPGVTCSRFARAIARVGLYVPGGTAVLPSTALMLGVPAQVAGCEQIVLATPPRADGSVSPEVLYVAHLVGAHAILRAGGAQAIAALAYGTETCPKVDKIFGPGNQWVTAAKMLVQNDTEALVSIDMPAGPSEVLVIADESCNPAFVAADLLSQAEHGVDSQVVLVSSSLADEKLKEIEKEVDKQARALPRVDIVRESVSRSLIVKTPGPEEAIQFSNAYAPEHLILHLQGASSWVEHVKNAGSVFVGPYSPESCGDYASGTNHTLPTNGYARQFSGVNTASFQKHITSQEITVEGLRILGPAVATLADCEGLQAHANAVRIRLAEF